MSILSIKKEDNCFDDLGSLEGFWNDLVEIDWRLITANRCPLCANYLSYQGMSNSGVYKAFGVCEPCKYAKLFWTEPAVFGQLKQKISKLAKEKKAA